MPKLPTHDPRGTMDQKEVEIFNALRSPLLKMSTKDVDKWVDKNVKDMAGVKELMKVLACAVAALAQKQTTPRNPKKTG
ncbi:MAG: hypothetical protein Q8N34_03175 [Gammaproteobacteria bacterium]|nr:hypothetical protein [Gammaproteobacteria bacterium]